MRPVLPVPLWVQSLVSMGPNGAGKSTFFKMLTGELTPDSGEIQTGKTVELAYVDQARSDLKGERTVWQEVVKRQKSLRWMVAQ